MNIFMLYNMYFINNSYLCSVDNRENNKRCLTAFRNAEGKKEKDYEKEF